MEKLSCGTSGVRFHCARQPPRTDEPATGAQLVQATLHVLVIAPMERGADVVVNNGREDALAVVRGLTDGLGAHSVVEAVGTQESMWQAIHATRFSPPRFPVYANSSAAPYPDEPAAMQALLDEHLLSSVEFVAGDDYLYFGYANGGNNRLVNAGGGVKTYDDVEASAYTDVVNSTVAFNGGVGLHVGGEEDRLGRLRARREAVGGVGRARASVSA